jgi:hypothetical protein
MKNILLICACLLALAGCTREYVESSQAKEFLKKDPSAAAAVAAVRDYNKALIAVYQANDLSPVKDLVVDREFNKLKHMIEGFQSENVKMEAVLKQLEIEQVERWGKDNVVVQTREKWEYRRVNTQNGAVVKPLTQIEYHMSYKWVFQDGRWRLFNLAPAGEKG